jgi:inorganic pyrophosphatase
LKYDRLPTFDKSFIRVVIETPKGATVKLSYDSELKVFAYSNPLPVGISYPFDWGVIPSTLGDDGVLSTALSYIRPRQRQASS